MGRRSRKRGSAPSEAPAAAREAPAAAREAPAAAREAPAAARAAAAPVERGAAAAEPARDGAARRAGRARPGRREQAPEAPWGRFPLVELCVLSAIGLGVAGFVVGGRSGNVLLTGAVLMGSVAGLEVAIREHLGGYRSHTLILSATLAVATMAVLFLSHVDRSTMVPVAVAVFALAFAGFRALFKRRSGGFGMKVR